MLPIIPSMPLELVYNQFRHFPCFAYFKRSATEIGIIVKRDMTPSTIPYLLNRIACCVCQRNVFYVYVVRIITII